jgi:hypothetical protein
VSRFAARSENVSRGTLDGNFLGQIVTKMIFRIIHQQMLLPRFIQTSKIIYVYEITRTEPMSIY